MLAADILVIAGPIWLGDNSSQTKKIIERLYAHSGELNDRGQWLYYGRVGGCLITGNEDGIKHCASNVLYSLQHIGYSVPPQADAGWIGEAGPGPSYGDELPDGSRVGLDNDFTNRNTTFMTWNLLHLAAMLKRARRLPGLRQPAPGVGRRCPLRLRQPRVPLADPRRTSRVRQMRAAFRSIAQAMIRNSNLLWVRSQLRHSPQQAAKKRALAAALSR